MVTLLDASTKLLSAPLSDWTDYYTIREQIRKFFLDIIRYLPNQAGAYILMDSWYTNPGVLDACREKGRHLIGAMKTNRILFPEEKRTAASDLAASLDPGCFHPVTVKGRTYMVYRYKGPLNKIDHAVVLRSYPASAMGKKCALPHRPSPLPGCFRQFLNLLIYSIITMTAINGILRLTKKLTISQPEFIRLLELLPPDPFLLSDPPS